MHITVDDVNEIYITKFSDKNIAIDVKKYNSNAYEHINFMDNILDDIVKKIKGNILATTLQVFSCQLGNERIEICVNEMKGEPFQWEKKHANQSGITH